ncbi:hypothetical protein ACS6X4_10035, partial [Streptococcus suis]
QSYRFFYQNQTDDVVVDGTEVHQAKSTRSEFDFRRVLMIQIPVGEKRKTSPQTGHYTISQ